MTGRMGSCIIGILVAIPVVAGTLSAPAQSQPRAVAVQTAVCNYQDLCYTLVKQAQKVLDDDGDLCAVPIEDRRRGVRRPDWRPVEAAAQADVLGRALPRLGGEVARLVGRIQAEMPNAPAAQARQAFWQRYGKRLIEAIAAGRGSLEVARLDFDNASPKEDVYRVTHLEPVDPGNPDGPWRAKLCNRSGAGRPIPLYAIFLSEGDAKRIGSPALDEAIGSRDLFLYRGRTYAVSNGPTAIGAQWIRNQQQGAVLSPVADLVAGPPGSK